MMYSIQLEILFELKTTMVRKGGYQEVVKRFENVCQGTTGSMKRSLLQMPYKSTTVTTPRNNSITTSYWYTNL